MKLTLIVALIISSLSLQAQRRNTKEEFSLMMTQAFYNMTGNLVEYVEPKCSVDTDYDYHWLFSDSSLHMNKNDHRSACKKIDSFLNILSKMDKALSASMKTNSHFHDINVVLQKKFDNAFYSKGLGEVITMPKVFYQTGRNKKDYSKHPKYLNPIVMHEYAHYIIEKNLGPVFDKYLEKYEDNPAAYLIRSGIHEFLADVFTVALTQNPDSIRDSLYHVGPQGNTKYWKASTNLRSFGKHDNSLKAIGTRLRKFGKDVKAVISTSEGRVTTASKHIQVEIHYGGHNLLTPTRYHVYKHYLSNPRFNKNKGRLISTIMKAVGNRLKTLNPEAFRKSARKDAAAAYVKLNKIFIEAIDSI